MVLNKSSSNTEWQVSIIIFFRVWQWWYRTTFSTFCWTTERSWCWHQWNRERVDIVKGTVVWKVISGCFVDFAFHCFVDFQKAFDTVIHTGIKIKLLHAGVGSLFYNIISRMYEISKSCVKVSNDITDFFPIKVGVKQGDNL